MTPTRFVHCGFLHEHTVPTENSEKSGQPHTEHGGSNEHHRKPRLTNQTCGAQL